MKRFIALAVAAFGSIATALATVNVNTAQQSELQRVKGLDKLSAKRIIEYRAANGDYRTLDELDKVVDHATVEKVKPELSLAGDPYVPPPKPEKAKTAKKPAGAKQ